MAAKARKLPMGILGMLVASRGVDRRDGTRVEEGDLEVGFACLAAGLEVTEDVVDEEEDEGSAAPCFDEGDTVNAWTIGATLSCIQCRSQCFPQPSKPQLPRPHAAACPLSCNLLTARLFPISHHWPWKAP
jgi:hypothetical protein